MTTDPPKLHPSIKGDQHMSVHVSRHRTAANSDAARKCPRGARPCGVCAGENVRCIFYEDDSGNAWTKYSMEFLCLDCGNYTTWHYDD